MTTGRLDPGLAADVSLGQPVTQLLLLFFVTLLICLFHFSLLEFSCSDVLEAPFVSPLPSSALPCSEFLGLSQLFSFFMFYRLGFLSLPCSASSIQTVAKPPNV